MTDHAGLAEAARFGDVIPAIVVDPKRLAQFSKNPRRAAYYCGAVRSLGADIEARGARLLCRRGETIGTIVRLAREARVDRVVWSAGYDARTQRDHAALQSKLEEAGLRVTIVHDAIAVAPEETAAARSDDGGRGYRSLAAYLAVWSALPREPHAAAARFDSSGLETDALPDVAECGAEHVALEEPTEARARAAIERYLAGGVLAYRSARNVPGGEPTSRCSAALSFGLLSARTILRALDDIARDPFLLTEERSALTTFAQALARRDFFLQLAWFFEAEPDQILQARMRAFAFAKSHPHLDAFHAGRTGFPLVDAGMRELRSTGWMHPRVRLVAASFLCFDLGVDWRVGRDLWNAMLVEDDPALANGNWQWSAGVGADLAQFPRIYNPRKQLRSFDPAGTYVRRWVPELAHLPDTGVLESRSRAPRNQLALPLFGESRYPQPIVEHEPIALAFLQRYTAFVRATAK